MELHNVWHTLLIYQEHKRSLFPNTQHWELNKLLCLVRSLGLASHQPQSTSLGVLLRLLGAAGFALLAGVSAPSHLLASSPIQQSLFTCQYCPCEQALEMKTRFHSWELVQGFSWKVDLPMQHEQCTSGVERVVKLHVSNLIYPKNQEKQLIEQDECCMFVHFWNVVSPPAYSSEQSSSGYLTRSNYSSRAGFEILLSGKNNSGRTRAGPLHMF